MTVEAIPYSFPKEPYTGDSLFVREETLKRITEGMNELLERGEYVGHIVVGEAAVIFLINTPEIE